MRERVYGEKKKNWGIREREWEKEIRQRVAGGGRKGRKDKQAGCQLAHSKLKLR